MPLHDMIPALHTHTYVHIHASRVPLPPRRVDTSLNHHVHICLRLHWNVV